MKAHFFHSNSLSRWSDPSQRSSLLVARTTSTKEQPCGISPTMSTKHPQMCWTVACVRRAFYHYLSHPCAMKSQGRAELLRSYPQVVIYVFENTQLTRRSQKMTQQFGVTYNHPARLLNTTQMIYLPNLATLQVNTMRALSMTCLSRVSTRLSGTVFVTTEQQTQRQTYHNSCLNWNHSYLSKRAQEEFP